MRTQRYKYKEVQAEGKKKDLCRRCRKLTARGWSVELRPPEKEEGTHTASEIPSGIIGQNLWGDPFFGGISAEHPSLAQRAANCMKSLHTAIMSALRERTKGMQAMELQLREEQRKRAGQSPRIPR